jgi:hypothetical protein
MGDGLWVDPMINPVFYFLGVPWLSLVVLEVLRCFS